MTTDSHAEYDVFLSYAREERATAASLASQLEALGYRLWWDTDLVAGQQFHTEILEKISASRYVVVLWSPDSVASAFVLDEASRGLQQEKLIPVSLDATPPPLGFGALHTVNMLSSQPDASIVLPALQRSGVTDSDWHGRQNRPDSNPDAGSRSTLPRVVVYAVSGLILSGLGLVVASHVSERLGSDQSGPAVNVQERVVVDTAEDQSGETATDIESTSPVELDATVSIDQIYSGPPVRLDARYANQFSAFLSEHGLRRVAGGDLLYLGNEDTFGECREKNHVPPKELWSNIIPAAKALELIRAETRQSITVVSAYRSGEFNTCIGGAPRSHHLTFQALDLTSSSLDSAALAKVVKELRAEGKFTGGVGMHEKFLHLDGRGKDADW
ncbi:hypothetical protein AB833_20020 [Chromatiales bacterium (ex Bugula neritina AB1)]|nr:hypothetical protein AB833_20020 [Chromatiales bacterium (ex Bugula neritina AB1)]